MKRRPTATAPLSLAALTEQGRRLMARGAWREAAEVYKKLLKQDPTGGWEPHLSSAYEHRAAEMAGKSQHKEALVLLDNADRLWTTPRYTPLRLTCLVAVGRAPQAVAYYLQAESTLQATAPALFPILQASMAVLLLTTPEAASALPGDSPWHHALTVARQALTAFCQPDQPDLESHLRNISIRSPFKPLRTILKALMVVRTEPEKAQSWVAAIPDTSPWSGLARLVGLCSMPVPELLHRADAFSPQAVAMAVAWHGIDPKHWQMARTLLTAPPQRALPLLLDPNLSERVPIPLLRRAAFLLTVAEPAMLAPFERRFAPLESLEKKRWQALVETRSPHTSVSHKIRSWQNYLRALSTTPETPDHPIRIALVHRLLAHLIGESDADDPKISMHLEESLIHDPENRASHAALLSCHQEEMNDKAYRQVLDRALHHFPDDGIFLYDAVRLALRNQTFKKAARLAKRLLTQDPLHAEVRRDLVGACLAQARKQVKTGRLDLATKELAEAATWERPDDRDGKVLINQAFLSWLANETATGNALLEAGKQEAGGGVPAALRATMEGVCMDLPARLLTPLKTTLTATARSTPTREAILSLVRVAHDYVKERELRQLLANLSKFWIQASSLFSIDEHRAICHLLAEVGVYAVLAHYATQGEKKWRGHKNHYIFSYYQLLAKYKGPQPDISERDYDRLEHLLTEAEKNGERELVSALIDWLEEREDEDAWEDEWEDEAFMPPFMSGGEPSQEEVKGMLGAMLTMSAQMFIEESRRPPSRSEVKAFLLALLEDAPIPMIGIASLKGEIAPLIEQVLDTLFPHAPGRTQPNTPAKKRGRGYGPNRQLTLDFDD